MVQLNHAIEVPGGGLVGMGWLPDYPDFRDYTIEHADIAARLETAKMVRPLKTAKSKPKQLDIPAEVDLRQWFPNVEDQQTIGSCTAQAGVGLMEYFEKRAFGKHIDASRLFLYKATRNLLGWSGDTGAYLRTTMGALKCFGVPPEKYWPYDISVYDEEPSAFLYALAEQYQAQEYFRLDPPGTTRESLLNEIKTALAGGIPCMFGFTVYSSIQDADNGKIPFPAVGESDVGGHAVVAAGYSNEMEITHPTSGETTEGAFLIRNSWGKGWGEAGYGWLPYKYVLLGQAIDWWSILKAEWMDTGQFGL